MVWVPVVYWPLYFGAVLWSLWDSLLLRLRSPTRLWPRNFRRLFRLREGLIL